MLRIHEVVFLFGLRVSSSFATLVELWPVVNILLSSHGLIESIRHVLERVVTTRSSRDESSTFYCLRHPSVLLPVSVSTLDFHFRQDLRLDFHKVESSVLIDDSSRCGCIGHG